VCGFVAAADANTACDAGESRTTEARRPTLAQQKTPAIAAGVFHAGDA
jgi:hypothetical protein